MIRFQLLYKYLKVLCRDGSQSTLNDSIYVPIDFKIRNTENNDLVWEYASDGSWLETTNTGAE